MKMKNNDLRDRVADIFDGIRKRNSKTKHGLKRFYPMSQNQGTKLVEYGAYDYESKKFMLFDCYSQTSEKDLRELENFVTV